MDRAPSAPASANPVTSGFTRRTLVKGAAWSVPAVTLLGATPAFASSPTTEISGVGTTCKHSGEGASNWYDKAYHIIFRFTNTSGGPVTFTLPASGSLAGGGTVTTNPDGVSTGSPIEIVVPPTAPGTPYQWVVHYFSTTSENTVLTITYSMNPVDGGSKTVTDSFPLSGDTCWGHYKIDDKHLCDGTTATMCSPARVV